MTNPTSDQLNDPEGQDLVQAIHDRKAQRDELRGTLANTICNASLYAKRAQPHLLGSDMSEVLDRTATAILAAGYRKPRTIGYIVVDVETKALDWDGELHPSEEAAIASLTGPRQMWCRSVEEEDDERTFWGAAYMICPVEAAK